MAQKRDLLPDLLETCFRLSAMGCCRTGCPFHHRRHPDGVNPRHGYCCNACRLEEGHTQNCTGYGEECVSAAYKRQRGATLTAVPRATQRRPTQMFSQSAFTIPDHWACSDDPDGIDQHLDWYDMHTRASGMVISPPAREAWRHLDSKLAHVNQMRPLIIHVLAETSSSPLKDKVGACINLHTRGINAHARAEFALDYAQKYMSEREAFGKTIDRFQALRHTYADCYADMIVCKEFNYAIAERLNKGEYVVKEATVSKLKSTKMSDEVIYQCLQFLGGYGYMEEYPLARLARDSRLGPIGGGTSEILREIIAKMVVDNKDYKPAT